MTLMDIFIEYGTETIDIGINGEILTVNNDFPFFIINIGLKQTSK